MNKFLSDLYMAEKMKNIAVKKKNIYIYISKTLMNTKV